MNRLSLRLLIAMLLIVPATTKAAFDYFASNRLLVRNGLQAVLMCNGLYTSHRALADVFDQELSYLVGERFGGIVGLKIWKICPNTACNTRYSKC